MVLPTLTWSQGNLIEIDSSGSTSTAAEVIAAVKTAILASSFWSIDSDDSEYLELTPTSGPISDATKGAGLGFRCILAGKSTAPAAGSMLSPDTGLAGGLHIGIAPDGGTFSTTTGWDDTAPFGASRWSKYWRAILASDISSVYIVESDEVLAIMFKGDDESHNAIGAVIVGALYEPIDDGSSSEADDRLYGMVTSGSEKTLFNGRDFIITGDFMEGLLNQNKFLSSRLLDGRPHVGVFRPGLSTFDLANRVELYWNTTRQSYRMDSISGTRVLLPIHYKTEPSVSPQYYIGTLRGIKLHPSEELRLTVKDPDNNVVGYILGTNADQVTEKMGNTIIFSNV